MSPSDSQEVINRVSKYLSTASTLIHMPIAEAMVMCKGKSRLFCFMYASTLIHMPIAEAMVMCKAKR